MNRPSILAACLVALLAGGASAWDITFVPARFHEGGSSGASAGE
jgi:hypothetical protein